MHPASAFRDSDAEFQDRQIAAISFATIFGATPDGPRAAHSPVVLRPGRKLQFHLARSNALIDHLESQRGLAVLNGPDAYISARWYDAENQVPTWDYMAFECEGTVSRLEDNALVPLLETLSGEHEQRLEFGEPWTMDKTDENVVRSLLKGIVGFELQVENIRETVKLSQNKSEQERANIIRGLEAEGQQEMAELMRDYNK